MKFSRRQFIGLTIYSGLLPFYNKFTFANPNLKNKKKSILILIELRGGNDGLNTIIPYKNPIYFSERPNISINNYIKLNSELAINPFMKEIMPLWKEKKLTFVLGLGWPKPNRSHFVAMDQWSSGEETGIGKGWLAKISDSIKSEDYLLSLGPTSSNAIEGGIGKSLHFAGNEKKIISQLDYKNLEILKNRKSLQKYLNVDKFINNEIIKIKNKTKQLPLEIKLPKGPLSKQTAMALKLINTNSPPTFIHMEQSGFDTHQNQINRQNKKLKELSENIYTLKRGSEKLNKNVDLNIIITSEFGRRLKENGTKGTDHGSASVAFLIGDSFTEKFLGSYPELSKLDSRGDLIPNIYPKDFYAYIKDKIWNN